MRDRYRARRTADGVSKFGRRERRRVLVCDPTAVPRQWRLPRVVQGAEACRVHQALGGARALGGDARRKRADGHLRLPRRHLGRAWSAALWRLRCRRRLRLWLLCCGRRWRCCRRPAALGHAQPNALHGACGVRLLLRQPPSLFLVSVALRVCGSGSRRRRLLGLWRRCLLRSRGEEPLLERLGLRRLLEGREAVEEQALARRADRILEHCRLDDAKILGGQVGWQRHLVRCTLGQIGGNEVGRLLVALRRVGRRP